MTEPHVHGADERVEIDLSALAGALKRALRWLLPLCIAVAIATVVVLQFVPSKYRAESKVLIQTSDSVYPGDVRGVEEALHALSCPQLGGLDGALDRPLLPGGLLAGTGHRRLDCRPTGENMN